MNTTANRFKTTFQVLCIGLVAAGVAAPGSASLADSAGIWATQPVEVMLVAPDGAKASADLGPARTATLGHLDSDGVIDLVTVYGSGDRGFATVTLGDPRFRLGPHHDRERELAGLPPERPFATEAVVYQLPFVADWVAVGDWDSDGDFDVVFAAKERDQLFWMAGDGRGRLTEGGMVQLEGGVTAMVAGEVNLRDGLQDLAVAVNGASGPALLVFQHPQGALKVDPELFAMPEEVTSLAVDWLDGDVWKDVAAAAGDEIVVLWGRNREWNGTASKRATLEAPELISFAAGHQVLDLAVCDFVGVDREMAVRLADGEVHLMSIADREVEVSRLGQLPAEGRLSAILASGLSGHDLVVQRPSTGRVEIFHANPSTAVGPSLERVPAPETLASELITGRLNVDSRDDLILLREDGTVDVAASKNRIAIVVDTTDDIDNGGCHYLGCSLREAIISANIQPAGSTITFDLPVNSTIEPTSQLPTLTQPAASIIDGTVGSGPITGLLTLQGASAGDSPGLVVEGGNATVMNMIIVGFNQSGIGLATGDNNSVKGCRVGTDGWSVDGNGNGIVVGSGSEGNTIGGTAVGEGNVIAGNTFDGVGISVSDNNFLGGNLVGTNVLGNSAVANGRYGIALSNSHFNTIGSAIAGGGNVVSGNEDGGIKTSQSTDSVGQALVIGNAVGVDQTRSVAIANGDAQSGVGILVSQESYDVIGGSNDATRNVISGNSQAGIEISNGCPNTTISGNYIGTGGEGMTAIPNRQGIFLDGCESATIGGSTAGEGNLISGNEYSAILSYPDTFGPSDQVDIRGNAIGVAIDGSPLGNGGAGIYLAAVSDAEVNGNTIAHNGHDGVAAVSTSSVFIGINSIFENTDLGIDLGADGVTLNDHLDADDGPNNLQNFPEIQSVDVDSGTVGFIINSAADQPFDLRFFESPNCDPSGYGEGKTYLGAQNDVTTDGSGVATGQVVFADLTPGSVITATATDIFWNTSEFSPCFMVPYGAGHIFSDGFESGDTSAWVSQ